MLMPLVKWLAAFASLGPVHVAIQDVDIPTGDRLSIQITRIELVSRGFYSPCQRFGMFSISRLGDVIAFNPLKVLTQEELEQLLLWQAGGPKPLDIPLECSFRDDVPILAVFATVRTAGASVVEAVRRGTP